MLRLRTILLAIMWLLVAATALQGQAAEPAPAAAPGIDLQLRLGGDGAEPDVAVAIQLLVLFTLLSMAPAIVMLTTSFLRIIIVLSFLRNAMGLQSTPPNQVLIGMALFLSFFLMMPVGERIHAEAIVPLQEKQITSVEALERATVPLREFMLTQTRPSDIDFFLGLAELGPTTSEDLPMRIIIPSFVMSELRTAFQMGFLIFLPFLVVDFIVATVLMAMGMMMMPPVIVSLPFKILLFVLVDGWFLIIRSIVGSFYQ